MNSNLIEKNTACREPPFESLRAKRQGRTAPDPISPKSETELLAEVPEESVWLANFISSNTKRTYLIAIREFIAFHEITNAAAGE